MSVDTLEDTARNIVSNVIINAALSAIQEGKSTPISSHGSQSLESDRKSEEEGTWNVSPLVTEGAAVELSTSPEQRLHELTGAEEVIVINGNLTKTEPVCEQLAPSEETNIHHDGDIQLQNMCYDSVTEAEIPIAATNSSEIAETPFEDTPLDNDSPCMENELQNELEHSTSARGSECEHTKIQIEDFD